MLGKKIVLGVCGGIAAYKAVELLRLYVKAGAEVHVVMTRSAMEFVTPLTFQTLSGNPVHTELFNLYQEKEIGHISLADRADLFVIAPATANVIGKTSCGIADDLLTTTIMATKAPVLFVPSMNVNMWENPVYQQNESRLKDLGYHFLEPDAGFLACGWEGKGKLPDPQRILEETRRLLSPQDLRGETVLVTAGPTREKIDPVRFLSNFSSGKMGYAVARVARDRGARVILISGPTALEPPTGVEFIPVSSAVEMRDRALEALRTATVIIKSAAVADYRPAETSERKIKKEKTGDLHAYARTKLEKKNLDLIVANDVTREGAGFDVDTNIVHFLMPDGTVEDLPRMTKEEVARRLLDKIKEIRGSGASRG